MSENGSFNDFLFMLESMNENFGDSEIKNEKKEINDLVNNWNNALEGCSDDMFKNQYEICYSELYVYLMNKIKEIKEVEEQLRYLSGQTIKGVIAEILKEKKKNVNIISKYMNRITEKRMELCDGEKKKYSEKKVAIYDEMKHTIQEQQLIEKFQEILNNQSIQQIQQRFNQLQSNQEQSIQKEMLQEQKYDNDMIIIYNSKNKLKQWSNKTTFEIIFDSEFHGDGWKFDRLWESVIDHTNLYFISFDGQGNAFGGYVSVEINKDDENIVDPNGFIFSLTKNNKVENTIYFPKTDESSTFYLYREEHNERLYTFGEDIKIFRIGNENSTCQQNVYYYGEKNNSLRIKQSINDVFSVRRIIVLQMNN